jgi:KDO2-lipid IV(A) lauroyltransferase
MKRQWVVAIDRSLVCILELFSRIVCAMPNRWALALGRIGGECAALVLPRSIQRIADHHTAMFGHPPRTPRRFQRAVLRHYGMLAIEILRLPVLARQGCAAVIDLAPARRFHQQLLARYPQRQPMILTSGHFGNWEYAAAMAAAIDGPLHVVVRPLDLPLLDHWLNTLRAAAGVTVHSKWNVLRPLLQALRERRSVALLTDQHARQHSAIWVRHGTRLAATIPSLALLHLRSRAPIVVGTVIRTRQGYRTLPIEIIDIAPDSHGDQTTRVVLERIHDAIVRGLRAYPEQYLWTHRRWRTPPPELSLPGADSTQPTLAPTSDEERQVAGTNVQLRF